MPFDGGYAVARLSILPTSLVRVRKPGSDRHILRPISHILSVLEPVCHPDRDARSPVHLLAAQLVEELDVGVVPASG